MRRKRREKRDPLADSWMRIHLVDGESVVLSHVQVRDAGGYVTGRKATGGEIAYPPWRVSKLEALKPVEPDTESAEAGVFYE